MKLKIVLLVIMASVICGCGSAGRRDPMDQDEVAAKKLLMNFSADDLRTQVDELNYVESSFEYQYTPEEIELIEYAENLGRYQIVNGDGLKLIAYKIYGDMDRWKELLELNQDLVDSDQDLSAVVSLRYIYPEKIFDWEVVGEPYLIQADDTPASIAQKIYADSSRWLEIYKNNPHLLKDPKVVYPGFTIYYLPDVKAAN